MRTIEQVLRECPGTQAADWEQIGTAWVHVNARVGNGATVGDGATVGNYAVWMSTPLYVQGTRHAACAVSQGVIAIGCQIHTVDEWRTNGSTIGHSNNYTDEQIAEYQQIVEWFAAWFAMHPNDGLVIEKKEKATDED